MALRTRFLWILGSVLLALPAQAATTTANSAVADPTPRGLMSDLFLEAQAAEPSLLRDLLPGHADEHTVYFPLQYLVPIPNNSTPGVKILGYPLVAGQVQSTTTDLGIAQGTGMSAAAMSLAGSACYIADGSSDNLAGFAVDLETSEFSNLPGAPFATGSEPGALVVEPSGRFLYSVINGSSPSVNIYSLTLATSVPVKVGSVPLVGTSPAAITASRQCVFVSNKGSGGYEVFAINPTTGTLTTAPGSPFLTHQAASIARTPDGNFVYFSAASPGSTIDGFFVDPSTCALSAVPGSPFTSPSGGVLRINQDQPALYAAGAGTLLAYAVNPATGALSTLGSGLSIGPNPSAIVVGPKGYFLWVSDLTTHKLAGVSLSSVNGAINGHAAAVTGPANVDSMVLVNENGGQLIGLGVAQKRTERVIGGAPPYSFALTGGALPAGLSFDAAAGEIVGTPTKLGESAFQITVTDAVGHSTTTARALKVISSPSIPDAPSDLTATVNSATQVGLTWQDNADQTGAFQTSLSQDGGPFVDVQAEQPTSTATVINGLSPATSYTFRLRASNAAGGTTDTTTATVSTSPLPPASCPAGQFGQCLLDGRFLLEAIFQDAKGDAGLAHVVSITSDTAYLWFFNSSNVEAVVKVLNGCPLGDHFWVFAGGLTNVHVILRLTDVTNGAVRYYEVPYGPAFEPIQDTAAFGNCSASDSSNREAKAAAKALPESSAVELDSRLFAQATVPTISSAGNHEQPRIVASCTPNSTTLCLNNSRFRVQASFDAGSSGSGGAHVGSLTPDTGYLWFFSASDVEAVIKVLSGCGVNGHYWVFAGGLTNVAVTLTVTDTTNGQQKIYNNPANTIYEPIQDTSAFTSCP